VSSSRGDLLDDETANRFRQLEAPRSDAAQEPTCTRATQRFDGLLAPGEKPPLRASASAFQPPPEKTASIPVDVGAYHAVPRNDCPRCERPNNLFDKICVGCGTRLDTAEARAHNEKLWCAGQAAAEPDEVPAPPAAPEAADPLTQAMLARREELEALAAREMGRRPRRAGEQIALWRAIMRRGLEEDNRFEEEFATRKSRANLPVSAAVVLALFLLATLMGCGLRWWHLPVALAIGVLLVRRPR
jgi:hypothetical protein